MTFDTKEAIETALGSYSTFYDCMCARFQAGVRQRSGAEGQREELTPFVVAGRFVSDQYGQCFFLNREVFTDEDRANMPPVMTAKEFTSYCAKHVLSRFKGKDVSLYASPTESLGLPFMLPPPSISCSFCFGTWEFEKCHNVFLEGGVEDFDLTAYVGKTLADVERILPTLTDSVRVFGEPLYIRNKKLSSGESEKGLDREEKEAFLDTVVEEGDFIRLFQYKYYHEECFQSLKAVRREEGLQENVRVLQHALTEVGFKNVRVTQKKLPEHLKAWFSGGVELGPVMKTEKDCIAYYGVKTNEGNFGIVVTIFSALDLTGTGISPEEVEPEMSQSEGDSPPLVGIMETGVQCARLLQLLKKKKRKRATKKNIRK